MFKIIKLKGKSEVKKAMLSLRAVEDEDISRLEKWLNQDYVIKWFEDPEDWLIEIKGRNDEFYWIKHFIIELDDRPIGFCQYYDCSKTEKGQLWDNEPEGTFGIDYMIGDPKLLGQGIGKQIVGLISQKTIRDKQPVQLIADPNLEDDKLNIPSIRALESNGYHLDQKSILYKKQIVLNK